ncbi:P-loop containing nucleoside triphosphate hydrolase protein [Cerioporus squamosus]|nr:P-loop containing nucleoside triphosphate hydrolase protein [Cerioporus squamosus]
MTNQQGALGDSEYARRRRELLALARSLNRLGADGLLDIPRIVVIGKQSAGKSSLVEAVTWIKVPRDAGTCTRRCPMECNISTDAQQWSCTVSLRRDGPTGDEPFSPELKDKNEVELWIRRAQATVLCPHLPGNTFMAKSREEIKTLTETDSQTEVLPFTKSKVVININDPEGTDLSFVDLPGLIENDRTDVIKLVDDLTLEYISSSSTIILVTAPADDEMENQKAMRFAREKDPHGKRTICVVTKADMVDGGSSSKRKLWQEIFEGKSDKHRLSLGYYAVRLPKDDERERGITAQELQVIATQVFNVVAPWKDVGGRDRDRLGVHSLVRDLSRLLMKLLDAALPRLHEQANKLLMTCLLELSKLPEILSDGVGEVVQRIAKFYTDMQAVVYGRSEDKSFVHRSRDAYRSFRWAIRHSAPDFRPFENPGEYTDPGEPDYDMIRRRALALSKDDNVVIGLFDVRDVIKRCTGWEILPYVPYEANVQLIKTFVKQWSDPAQQCFVQVQVIVDEVLAEKVSEHFGRFPLLKQDISLILRHQLEEYVSRSTSKLSGVLQREEPPYWTQNAHHLGTTYQDWLDYYRSVHCRQYTYIAYQASEPATPPLSPQPTSKSKQRAFPDYEAEAVRALRAIPAYRYVTAVDLPRLSHPGNRRDEVEYDDELKVMAGVRSYFQVAYKRVTDVIPNTIQRDLVEDFVNSLQGYLLQKLEIGSADASQRLQTLLAEDPSIAQTRIRLQDKRRKLEEIRRQLENFRV